MSCDLRTPHTGVHRKKGFTNDSIRFHRCKAHWPPHNPAPKSCNVELTRHFILSLLLTSEPANCPAVAKVDYQVHETEELVDELRPADPHEGNIRAVEYFDEQILPALEAAEDAVDAEQFETSYDQAISQCNACHGATGYEFIRVIRPERNPYTNLEFGTSR